MSLDMTKVIDKLKPIEKRRNEAEAYFRIRENYQKKAIQFDFSIKSKLCYNKLNFEEKMISKTSSLLKKLTEIDPHFLSQITHKLNKSIDEQSQTEEDEFQMMIGKISKLESKNDKLLIKNQNYKKEIGVAQQEITNLRLYISKLEKENKSNLDSLDKLLKENSSLLKHLNEYKIKDNEANEKLVKTEKIIEDYNDMKNLIEERVNIDKENKKLIENQDSTIKTKYSSHIFGLVYYELIHEVAGFLNSKDIFALKLSSKSLYSHIDEDTMCMKHLLRSVISEKNKEIFNSKKSDIRLEFEINDLEIEKLINDYVVNKKLPGKELRTTLLKAINFLNKDVKVPLGIKVNNQTPKIISTQPNNNNYTNVQQNSGGFFSGIATYFLKPGTNNQSNNIINPKPQSIENGSNSKGSIIPNYKGGSVGIISKEPSGKSSFCNLETNGADFEKYDKMLLSENHHSHELDIDFEYGSIEDIKQILNKFLKSNFSTDKLMAFIREVVCEYSELLFLSNKTLNEIKEIEIVKSAFVERFAKYKKLFTKNDNELKDIRRFIRIGNETNKAMMKPIEEYEKIYVENEIEKERLSNELQRIKANFKNIHEKYDKINIDHISFKTIFAKELRNLKFDLHEMTKERNLLRDNLFEFIEFFKKFNINEKGEIMID